ncbi:MAG: hypothetical protein IV100_10995 [Myxococcales bacterium]|nr:hypothetical protein [Myxococcales bacterium]
MASYPAPALVTWGIAGISAVVAVLSFLLVRRAAHAAAPDRAGRLTLSAGAIIVAWVAFVGLLSGSGLLARFDLRPPPIGLLLPVILAAGLTVGLSARTTFLVNGLPLAALVGLQAFRLPLELVMHEAANAGVMPVQLSFSGYNFDIVTGAGAAVLAPLIAMGKAPRWAITLWNLYGFLALAAIAVIAILTAPFVRFFGDGSVNAWVAYLPFTYLPALLVVVALIGHCLVARWLRAHPTEL